MNDTSWRDVPLDVWNFAVVRRLGLLTAGRLALTHRFFAERVWRDMTFLDLLHEPIPTCYTFVNRAVSWTDPGGLRSVRTLRVDLRFRLPSSNANRNKESWTYLCAALCQRPTCLRTLHIVCDTQSLPDVLVMQADLSHLRELRIDCATICASLVGYIACRSPHLAIMRFVQCRGAGLVNQTEWQDALSSLAQGCPRLHRLDLPLGCNQWSALGAHPALRVVCDGGNVPPFADPSDLRHILSAVRSAVDYVQQRAPIQTGTRIAWQNGSLLRPVMQWFEDALSTTDKDKAKYCAVKCVMRDAFQLIYDKRPADRSRSDVCSRFRQVAAAGTDGWLLEAIRCGAARVFHVLLSMRVPLSCGTAVATVLARCLHDWSDQRIASAQETVLVKSFALMFGPWLSYQLGETKTAESLLKGVVQNGARRLKRQHKQYILRLMLEGCHAAHCTTWLLNPRHARFTDRWFGSLWNHAGTGRTSLLASVEDGTLLERAVARGASLSAVDRCDTPVAAQLLNNNFGLLVLRLLSECPMDAFVRVATNGRFLRSFWWNERDLTWREALLEILRRLATHVGAWPKEIADATRVLQELVDSPGPSFQPLDDLHLEALRHLREAVNG